MTTRGFKEKEFIKVGKIIAQALKNKNNKAILNKLKEVQMLVKIPIYIIREIMNK